MNLHEAQLRFAAHLRDPDNVAPPHDVEDRRMRVYRELFFDNVASLLAGVFPVLERILGPGRWRRLVRDFYRDHRCHTPLFLEVSQEFLAYLGEERAAAADDPPFLYELAHYEWAELALSVSEEDIDADNVDPAGDLLDAVPVLSPLVWHLAYEYPVHKIGPDHQPDRAGAQPTFLVVYRDRSDEVGFMEINPVTKRLLELLEENSTATGRELLARIAAEMSHPQPEVVIRGGHDILENLRARDIVTGSRPAAVRG